MLRPPLWSGSPVAPIVFRVGQRSPFSCTARCWVDASAAPGVVVRYAPSPTGDLHLGGLRTALFNYLFARRHGGKFILRIEDTDKTREVPGAVARLVDDLQWCSVVPDEGPILTPNGELDVAASTPFVQSLHLERFRHHAEALIDSGHAYRCFCSTERLAALRKHQAQRGLPSLYDRACLALTPTEVADRVARGEPHVVRLKVGDGTTVVHDEVVGTVSFDHHVVDDQVLLKTDGFPTYHLAAVADDHAMGITHVVRGQEWLSSTPKHVMLFKALGFDVPKFAHLPLLLNGDKTKLSKRKGDVAVRSFADAGYLPEGLLNFVALLGWNPKDTNEFDLSGVNKANGVVDRKRLDWLNAQHLRAALADPRRRAVLRQHVLQVLEPQLEARGAAPLSSFSVEYIDTVLLLQHERVTRLPDFVDLMVPFFVEPNYKSDVARDMRAQCWQADTGALVKDLCRRLQRVPPATFHKEAMRAAKAVAKEHGVEASRVMLPVRLALTGMPVGPPLGELAQVLGQARCVQRLEAVVADV